MPRGGARRRWARGERDEATSTRVTGSSVRRWSVAIGSLHAHTAVADGRRATRHPGQRSAGAQVVLSVCDGMSLMSALVVLAPLIFLAIVVALAIAPRYFTFPTLAP